MKNNCTGNKKLLPFYILKILEEYSSESQPLTQEAIANYLDKNYNLIVERKAISRNIGWLKDDLKYDIENIHGKGYYLAKRNFEDSELRFLIDAVRFSKFVPKLYSNDIVEKLLSVGTPDFRKRMNAVKCVQTVYKAKARQIFLNIEEIDNAIRNNRKVTFIYNEYGANKELSPVWEEKVVVSPKELVAANGHYYLIGLIENNDIYTNFRLEKITGITVLEENVDPILKFDLKEYLSTHPLMYCGEPITATIKINPKIMGEVIDYFGESFSVCKRDEEFNEIVVRANEWDVMDFAMQNAYFAEVLLPKDLRQKLKRRVECLAKKYE